MKTSLYFYITSKESSCISIRLSIYQHVKNLDRHGSYLYVESDVVYKTVILCPPHFLQARKAFKLMRPSVKYSKLELHIFESFNDIKLYSAYM